VIVHSILTLAIIATLARNKHFFDADADADGLPDLQPYFSKIPVP
jgi:hypothetical protein